MSAHPLMLTYLDVRGRCEPVYLMLVDAGVNFTSEIITQKQWDSLKASSSTGPPQFPYFALPVLKAEGMVLAETSAILAFLDEHLAEKYEAPPLPVRVHMQMVREASLFFSNRVQDLSFGSKDWLGPEKRVEIMETIVKPFLRGTEYALTTAPMSSGLIPSSSDHLSSGSVAAFAAILMVLDLFPSLKSSFGIDGEFKACGQLCQLILERPRIREWYRDGRVEQMAWTVSEFGTAEYIAKEADKYDRK